MNEPLPPTDVRLPDAMGQASFDAIARVSSDRARRNACLRLEVAGATVTLLLTPEAVRELAHELDYIADAIDAGRRV